MKAILTQGKDNSYEFKNSEGVTWHIFEKWTPSINSQNIGMKSLCTKLVSTNPDYIQTGKLVRKIPNYLKSVIFQLNKK